MTLRQKRMIKRIFLLYIPLAIFLVFVLSPFYWIFVTSLKESKEVFATPITYWPKAPTLDNYINLFTNLGFGTYFSNSFKVSISVTTIVTLLALIGGFAAPVHADVPGSRTDDPAVQDHELAGSDQ